MPRSAQEVIDQAIKENRQWERLLYGLAILFAVIGVTLILLPVFHPQASLLGKYSGYPVSAFSVPPAVLAERTKKKNTSLRMLELALSDENTRDEAYRMLVKTYQQAFLEKITGRR